MKIKIILNSLILLFSLNIYSQVYQYTSNTLNIINDKGTEYSLLESPWVFNLNLNNKILIVNHNNVINSYKILDYYKKFRDDAIYLDLENKNKSNNKFTISINHENKQLIYYLDKNTLVFIINNIKKVK